MSDLYRIDKERLNSMSDYQKHRVETALGTAIHDEVLIPVSDERLTRAEWEATINYEAAAKVLQSDESMTSWLMWATTIVDAAVGEETP